MKTLMIRSILALAAAVVVALASAQMAEPAVSDNLHIAEHATLGSYLVDARGRTLYVVVNENEEPVACTDECAEAWPPFTLETIGGMADDGMGMNENASAMGSIDPDLVDTVGREDGTTQLTYAGHPLYYFVGDEEPGEVNCQAIENFGGTWYVLAPSGDLVTTPL